MIVARYFGDAGIEAFRIHEQEGLGDE